VRLSSLDPHEINEKMVRLVAQAETLCPHFHIPLQSGDNSILQRMRRRYDTALTGEVLAMVRELLPHAAIGTDLIVGFPGEGEEEFAQGYAFLEEMPLTYFHVFPYSPRSGTTAAKFSYQVLPATIEERARQVRKLGEQKKAAFCRRFLGYPLPVLFEHSRDKSSSLLKGYSRNYLRTLVAAGDEWMNKEAEVRIERTRGGVAWGTLLEADG
jgi:threonylcarbamoyladenosine tRNA methylthiotransferase MtaB